jgi:hypothetical protein
MTTTDIITLSGVLTGLVGTSSVLLGSIVSYQTFRQEGYIIKLVGKRGWKIMNAVPPYSEDKTYSVVTVYNRGKRAANISKVGEGYLYSFGGSIYSDSMFYGPTRVDDDSARDYLGEENPNKKRPTTGYYYAVTQSGKMFRYYPYTRIIYWLCYPLRKIRRLSQIKSLSKSKKRKSSKKK